MLGGTRQAMRLRAAGASAPGPSQLHDTIGSGSGARQTVSFSNHEARSVGSSPVMNASS